MIFIESTLKEKTECKALINQKYLKTVNAKCNGKFFKVFSTVVFLSYKI